MNIEELNEILTRNLLIIELITKLEHVNRSPEIIALNNSLREKRKYKDFLIEKFISDFIFNIVKYKINIRYFSQYLTQYKIQIKLIENDKYFNVYIIELYALESLAFPEFMEYPLYKSVYTIYKYDPMDLLKEYFQKILKHVGIILKPEDHGLPFNILIHKLLFILFDLTHDFKTQSIKDNFYDIDYEYKNFIDKCIFLANVKNCKLSFDNFSFHGIIYLMPFLIKNELDFCIYFLRKKIPENIIYYISQFLFYSYWKCEIKEKSNNNSYDHIDIIDFRMHMPQIYDKLIHGKSGINFVSSIKFFDRNPNRLLN